jgi:hypothetical protein
MKLLTTANTKIKKGEKLGYKSYGVHLAPFNLSGYQVCKDASAGCAAACLNTAGMGSFSNVQAARIEKTKLFFHERLAFMHQLVKEVTAAIKSAQKQNQKPCFRLNLTSDLPWESIKFLGHSIMAHFPNVQWYDYTATLGRMESFLAGDFPANYSLTFSRKENTPDTVCDAVLKSGGNVAVVFRGSLPQTWRGFPVLNGDDTDLRFLDPRGCVVGLVEKGRAKKDQTGFVVEPQ